MGLITVDNYVDASIAELARMKLESEGIPVFLHSMGHASLIPSSSIGIAGAGALGLGGIRVQVPEPYEERAKEILQKLQEDLSRP